MALFFQAGSKAYAGLSIKGLYSDQSEQTLSAFLYTYEADSPYDISNDQLFQKQYEDCPLLRCYKNQTNTALTIYHLNSSGLIESSQTILIKLYDQCLDVKQFSSPRVYVMLKNSTAIFVAKIDYDNLNAIISDFSYIAKQTSKLSSGFITESEASYVVGGLDFLTQNTYVF
ncbi:UNKNOWN [Stylonychia lemnae]|uniref:Uncharacterized protein n=1 Tax=Stylonychia lemnae TaxID=5949 RepID=A0A078ATQ7_STYLE|nr:UNKNOWN [Stylonychia lemnae]|eukprot:CDW85629.1 UNKNOWN [Stylonychia lemnae]